jgi:hypothetical protein
MITRLVIEIDKYEMYEDFLSLLSDEEIDRLYRRMIEINQDRELEERSFRLKYGST